VAVNDFLFRCLRVLTVFLVTVAAQAAPYPEPVHGDFVIRDFRLSGGEVIPKLKLHYFTLGAPARDANGRVTNAVLLLHGTYGKGTNFLTEGFAGELFGAGQPLDARRFYIIVPDSLGHGRSTKPSDAMRAKFPRYGYADMVAAQRLLLADGLGVRHLRLFVGTSMGGMHAWMWAVSEPDFMDAVMPLVCLPDQIAGRNRMERRLITDAIRNDPEWNGGNYAKQPQGLTTAMRMVVIGAGSVKRFYEEAPTQEATDRLMDRQVQQRLQGADANDFLYAWEASRDYDPGPGLERIRAAVTAVNFEDDERNPPELGVLDREIKRVKNGRVLLIPVSDQTVGHGTTGQARFWKQQLGELLQTAPRMAH